MAVTYVVTGATGHIGNNVVRLLADKGERVIAAVRRDNDPALEGVSVMRAVGQLSDEEFLRGLIPEGACVVHCAGKIAISEREIKETFAVNVVLTRKVARICAQKHARLVYVCSTDAVFCGSENGDIRDNMLRMSEPKGFYPELMKGCYAQSKAAAGQYVLDECKNGLDACVVCPCAVLGANDYKPSLAGRLVRDYLRGAPLAVIDGGYDFISATDAARGIILAAQKGKSGECYILQGGRITVAQVYCELARLSGRRRHLPHIPVWLACAAGDINGALCALLGKTPRFTRYAVECLESGVEFDSSRTRAVLGFEPGNAEEAVREAYEFFSARRRP